MIYHKRLCLGEIVVLSVEYRSVRLVREDTQITQKQQFIQTK